MVEEEFPALVPGRLAGLAATVVRVRGAVSLEREKRRTITDVAECLTGSGQAGRVTHRDASGGEWTITLGPAASGSSRG
ncbi:hypothetical protein [Streptomyces stelliscabiei]|uniref:hypothetical protein n=1 Tax=Streptomyces stelliscabiei TaxID=146820 RepID=UPI0029AEE8FB|nr:hypothetical protein [Streptomyces stelliscabiei]MDX2557258.1 hypothetical protein [Streptomyces stelliscabiei]MDX2616352.1 hypothetical protein [Streptomyces stelliscabiei]MDX2641053.1 hypothetical protein [Streptomyces stelliscabiei]MDX2665115.1 hypothetical protein [Streptomyces stelliscabiei]MDX2716210.1 hypothetical protein [Streptomyces stelliscabiei]